MAEERVEEFLDLYRRLESAAESVVGDNGRGSAVFRLEKHPDYLRYADQLDCIREIRNFLSHEPKVGGSYAILPGDGIMASLRQILQLVEDPPLVCDRMTPVERLTVASLSDPLLPLMTEMERRHISHVPILLDGCVESVFSVSTVFQAAIGGVRSLDAGTTVGDLARWLPLDRHMGQDFRFVDPKLRLRKAREQFDSAYSRNRKLKLLLVTAGGRSDRPLLGVLSPYDVLDTDSL